ncbi:MAG TPA: gas vesicle protein [Streptosporangiaceae bacterium]|nr:gas vesicle protein [Streptosporangiaceae bacterium]
MNGESRQPAQATVGTPTYGGAQGSGREPANLGDILERVLDKGIVIAGDIRVNLLDIELLTIKLRLLIVSVETARELGIDWWEHDPWLTGSAAEPRELEEENRRLRERIADLEEARGGAELEAGGDDDGGAGRRREVTASQSRPIRRRASESSRRRG